MAKPYTVRGLLDIVMSDIKPLEYLWNGIALIPGGVVEIIGSPGIGKSRFVGDLAKHQILGLEYGGMPTFNGSLKWLFVGSENGIHRLDRELKTFVFGCSPDGVRGVCKAERFKMAAENGYFKDALMLLNQNFRTSTLQDPEDYDISLANDYNFAKLVATLKADKPNVIVFDPWGDLIAGEELNDGDVRNTIRIIRKAERDAGIADALIIIVNHARIGAKEEALARGMDAGNFGKNSKCLYSIARYVLNIRRASFDENPPIEVICAKNNDGVKPPPIALQLDQKTMSYSHVKDWDADKWQAELEAKARQRGNETSEARQPDKVAEVNAKREKDFLNAVVEVANEAGDKLLDTATFQQNVLKKPGGAVAKNPRSASFTNLWKVAIGPRGVLKSQRAQERKADGTIGNTKERREYVSTPDHIAAYLKQFEGLGI